MKSWKEFSLAEPELAGHGERLLSPTHACVGLGFLATLRKDGAPRLHPVSLVFSHDRLFLFIPPNSPKCGDLKRDGRYALQAFPPPKNEYGEEFYMSGVAKCILDPSIRQGIIAQTSIYVEEHEQLFELLVDRAMYTISNDQGASHKKFVQHPKLRSKSRLISRSEPIS
jgi:hypothetical protein